jgi:hypothetical protein
LREVTILEAGVNTFFETAIPVHGVALADNLIDEYLFVPKDFFAKE